MMKSVYVLENMMKSVCVLAVVCALASATRSPTSSPTAAPTAAPTYGPASATVVAEIFTGVLFGMLGTVILYIMWGRYSYDRDHKRNIEKYKAMIAARAALPEEGAELEASG